MYDGEDIEWGRANGVTIITMDEFADRSIADVMAEPAVSLVISRPMSALISIVLIRRPWDRHAGNRRFHPREAQPLVRQLQGLNLIGADLVEVSPPFDESGNTAWVGVSIMFELLCMLASSLTSTDERSA